MANDLSKKVELEHFWANVPPVKLSNILSHNSPELFRYSIDDLNKTLDNKLLIDRFDGSFYHQPTIISDAASLPFLLDLKGRSQSTYSCPDPSGWIYIYSNIAAIALGHSEEWFLFLRTKVKYECRLKIGRTTKHPIHRLRAQASAAALIHPMMILGIFWSPCIALDERNIHSRLDKYKVTDVPGIELFEIEPMNALEAIRIVLSKDRFLISHPIEEKDIDKESLFL
jgi:T5orf172 domain